MIEFVASYAVVPLTPKVMCFCLWSVFYLSVDYNCSNLQSFLPSSNGILNKKAPPIG